MNIVALIDLTAAAASLAALYFILSELFRKPGGAEIILFAMVVALTFTHDAGNFVEWAGWTNWFDPIEDYMEVLTAALWAFFFYTFAQELTERKLRAGEAKYRSLFDMGNDGIEICGIDPDGSPGRFLEVNDVACSMLGYTREEYLLLRPGDIDDQGPADENPQVVRKLLKDGRAVFERVHIAKDGRRIPVEISSKLFDFEGGKRVISMVRDITERKEAERKLREIQELDEKILDASPVAFVLHDPDLRIVRVSSAYQDVTGFVPENVMGRTLEEFMPDGPQKRKVIDSVRWVQDHGVQVGPQEIESPGLGRLIRETILPIFGKDRTVTNTLSVLEDITERKRAYDALARSEERYRMLYDSISDGVVIHEIRDDGMPGAFLEVNRGFCHLVGYRRKELMKMSPLDLEDPEEAGDMSMISGTLEMGGTAFFERKLVSKKGSLIPVEISAQTFQLGDRYLGLSVIRDISDRQEAQERIRNSLAEKEILLREIHHRVKNNLQVISGLLNLQSQYIGDVGVRSVFKESQNRIKTMALIHEELYQREDLALINLAKYLRDLVENLFQSYMVKKEAVELVLDIPALEINLDTAIPCGLIVNELVSNALKHAFPDQRKGKIEVSVTRLGGTYTLTISDDGVGLPEGMDYRKVKSMGMQLVVVLVEQLGGELTYNGEGGTSFMMTFKEHQEAGTEVH
ncbi:MAG: PAS domain S-box protein [bacterium]|nr:PAS domain S-box protein [bacterium]